MQLKDNEGEILGLTVKEISHVIAPAVDGVLKGQQLDACYLIVKENDPEDPPNGDDDDDSDIDVLLKKDATDISKEPVVQNTEMVTPTVSDETKMEMQRTLKELVANCSGMKPAAKLMLAKVCAYHGVDVPEVEDPQETAETTVDDEIERALGVMERLGKIVANVQPKTSTPTPAAKPAAPASASQTKEESGEIKDGEGSLITRDDLKNVFPDAIAAAGGAGQAETTTLAEEIRTETAKEVSPVEEPLLTRVARILEKQREQHELDEYMSVLKEAAKKIQSVQNEYTETKRSLLKAMGKDPDGDHKNQ